MIHIQYFINGFIIFFIVLTSVIAVFFYFLIKKYRELSSSLIKIKKGQEKNKESVDLPYLPPYDAAYLRKYTHPRGRGVSLYNPKPSDPLKFLYEFILKTYYDNGNQPVTQTQCIYSKTVQNRIGKTEQIRKYIDELIAQKKLVGQSNKYGSYDRFIPIFKESSNVIKQPDNVKFVIPKENSISLKRKLPEEGSILRFSYDPNPKDPYKFMYDFILYRYKKNNNKPVHIKQLFTGTLTRRFGKTVKLRGFLDNLIKEGKISTIKNRAGVDIEFIPLLKDQV